MDTPKDIIHWIDRALDRAQALQASMKQMQIDFHNKISVLREDLATLREKVYRLEQQASVPAAPLMPVPVVPPQTAPATSSAAVPNEPYTSRRKTPMPVKEEQVDPMSLPVDLDEAQDLRSSPRRRNTPMLVLIATTDPNAPVTEGWLLDRSLGGLGIIVEQSMDEGTLLRIRPADALPSFRWVRVQVRNCVAVGKRWKVGCRFEDKLSAKEMRQFE